MGRIVVPGFAAYAASKFALEALADAYRFEFGIDSVLVEPGIESLVESGFDEFRFMWRSAGHKHGERKTMTVADGHDFAAFTASSRADGGAPFFAELKLA
jgi:NAD(P)-dependent dehydrogenase (short-subunit alcohol dehydrogenase family)